MSFDKIKNVWALSFQKGGNHFEKGGGGRPPVPPPLNPPLLATHTSGTYLSENFRRAVYIYETI